MLPQILRLASKGHGAQDNHRPHYSADLLSGIAPRKAFSNSKPAPNFLATPANPNKIKGHKNPNANTYYFLS